MLVTLVLCVPIALQNARLVPTPDLLRVPQDFAQIQDAIDAARPYQRILVDPGQYGPIRFNGKAVQVQSASGPAVTRIVAYGLGVSCVRFHDGEGFDSQLIGFGVHGGSSYEGGGISCVGESLSGDTRAASPYIEGCIVSENHGDPFCNMGYGIGVCGGSPILYRCRIEENHGATSGAGCGTTQGGGVYGAPTMIECIVRSNSAQDGGGVYLTSGALLQDCLLIDNQVGPNASQYGPSYAEGAAGYASSGNVLLERCRFVGNTAYGWVSEGECFADVAGMYGGTEVDCMEIGNSIVCLE